MQNSKNAFTMIELIFVIVILGILAAVAIPKLSATRNDAKVAAEVKSAAQAIQNLGAVFTAKGSFSDYTVTEANSITKCFTFVEENTADGNISVAMAAVSLNCPAVVRNSAMSIAISNGLISVGGAKKYFVFAGTGVVE